MTSLTPWVTESEGEPLRLLAPAPVDDRILRTSLGMPLRWPAGPRWLPVIDAGLAAAVLTVPVRLAGPTDLSVVGGALLGLAWCLALALAGAWRTQNQATTRYAVPRAAALVGLGCWVAAALLDPAASPRQLLALIAALSLAALVPRLVLQATTGARHPVRVAVAGDGHDVRRMLRELTAGTRPRWEVSSVCLSDEDAQTVDSSETSGLAVWVGTHNVVDAALAARAQAILMAPGRALDPETVRRLAWAAHSEGLEVYVGTGLLGVAPHRTRLVSAGSTGFLRLDDAVTPSPAHAAKEVADRIGAALLVVAFLPVLCVIAAMVRWDTPGPSLFRQQRVGRDGRPFTMYKFRTMGVDATSRRETLTEVNECDAVLFKMRQDPRVTRVGAVLRRYSLDELPQLINVLRGEMALVGPRPALPDEVARYEEDPRRRLVVKPGLTGLWQVSGRSDLSWDESVRLDLYYVDNWSFLLDVRILLRTAVAVLGHRGAY